MKSLRIVFCLLLVSSCFLLHAQTEKGTVLLGGDFTFQTSDGANVFSASPNIGLMIMDDVGITATFSFLSTEGASSWALGPAIRLYLFGNDKGKMITQVGINVGGAKNTESDFGFDIAAGWALFLNQSIALELLASYRKTGDIKGIFSLGAGFQIHYRK